MQILPISFKLNNYNTQNPQYTSTGLIKPNYRNQLTKDTVSFGAAKLISDTVWHNFVKEIPRLKRIGMAFLDATEAIANKLKDDDVVFVRELFENHVVKGADSKLSKVNRSKTFDVRDTIRTTLFVKNPYDLSILFDKIIPEYTKSNRGYNIATILTSISSLMERGYIPFEEEKFIKEFFNIQHTKESHHKFFRELKKLGYDYDETKKLLTEYLKEGKTPNNDEIVKIIGTLKKGVPDIDIRLKKNRINISDIPEEYKYSLGKPQKSGYEDIQIRFIRDYDLGKDNPIYHELLIQFGPTYNKNAVKEHHMVYEPLRLFDELHIPTVNPENGGANFYDKPEVGVDKFISDIKKMFREGVSNKLIKKKKNEDFFGNIEDNEDIFFSDREIDKFDRRFKNLKGFLSEYYKQAKSRAQVSQLATTQIDKDFRDDLKIVNKIQKMLIKTINDVNHEFGLNDVG